MEALYTTGQVLELTKLTGTMFGNWCQEPESDDEGGPIVKAVQDVKGTGNHRSFSLTQVVGICVADELRNSDRGCHTKFVRKVVAAFGAMSEKKLANMLEGRAIYFMTIGGKAVILDDNTTGDRVNVQKIYRAVLNLATK